MKRKSLNNMIRLKINSSTIDPYSSQELKRMEEMLGSLSNVDSIMLNELNRVISAGGKRLRPVLALLSYKISKADGNDVVPLMYILELMHTTSLIHDDVVDNAKKRRGCPTINKTSGDTAAVQSGDYLLAKAMEQLGQYRGTGINEELADVSAQMCLGELEQLKIRFKINEQDMERYFLQIHRKTSSLIAASCYTGALAARMKAYDAQLLKNYGESLGTAFQLRDDLMDFSETGCAGKVAGQDLKNGIYTYPVLCMLDRGVPDYIYKLLENNRINRQQVQQLIDYVKSTNILKETEILIRYYIDDAVKSLHEIPDCMEKTALIELANVLAGDTLLKNVSNVC